jgi:hypothetical protein
MMPLVADGPNTRVDAGVSTVLIFGALLLGWVAFSRLSGRGFARLPRMVGWGAAALAAVCVALAVVLPPIIRPDSTSAARPPSTATLSILSPRPGQVFHGNPARVEVRLRLTGARIVPITSTRITPDRGHIHLFLDGALISMTFGTRQRLEVGPGRHTLEAEFVATDHAPFNPDVRRTVAFRVTR